MADMRSMLNQYITDIPPMVSGPEYIPFANILPILESGYKSFKSHLMTAQIDVVPMGGYVS